MPPGFFYDHAIELMIALFGASLFLGFALGYCCWGAIKVRLRQLTQENSKRQEMINQLAEETASLKAQLTLIE